MSTLFVILLSAHVVLGLVGVIASFAVTFMLLKRELPIASMKCASISAFLAYLLSWLAGGWYYWKYYGTAVKPAIMGGDFKWAHLIFMEAKEHVFLFLPFATACLALIIWLGHDKLTTDPVFKTRTMFLALMITILAIIVTLSGVLITGGAR